MVEIFTKCSSRILVDIFACVYGISAWLCVNGMFTQLPILVQKAPEGWKLPSYLSILIQIANIGPIGYSILKKYGNHLVRDSFLIYIFLVLGTTSVFFMAFFYFETTTVFGVEHSTPLFILTFGIALVGCTSSVLFIPFMNNYPEIHLVSYLVGEGLSGFIPGIVSLIQGVGVTKCVNSTDVHGKIISYSKFSPPLFSSRSYFLIMFLIMSMSTVSFLLLNKLPSCRSVKLRKKSVCDKKLSTPDAADCNSPPSDNAVVHQTPTSTGHSMPSPLYKGLLFLTLVISMFANGALPSIQSYSCLPYGTNAYHFAVNLPHMITPAVCCIAFFLPHTSVIGIFVMCVFITITITYNITAAAFSPAPPLQHELIGEIIIVISWVLCCGFISYVKLSIAALFRREGGRGLFLYGACTQAGAAVGSGVSFYLVSVLKVLKSYNPCA